MQGHKFVSFLGNLSSHLFHAILSTRTSKLFYKKCIEANFRLPADARCRSDSRYREHAENSIV